MEPYKLDASLDANKVFVVKRSELENRWDSKFYNNKVIFLNSFKFPLVQIKKYFIVKDGDHDKLPQEEISNEIEGKRYLRAQDIKDGKIISEKPIYISDNYFNKIKRCHIYPNDLLISIMASLGLNAIVPEDFPISTANRAVGILRNKTNNHLLTQYLQILIDTEVGFRLFEIEKKGGIQERLNLSDLGNVKIPIPPKEIQKQIVDIYNSAYAQKQAKEAEAKELLANIDTYLLNELGITLPEKDNSLEARIFTTNFSEVVGGRLDPDYISKIDFLISQNAKYEFKELKSLLLKNPQYGANEEATEIVSESDVRYIRITDIDEIGELKLDKAKTASKTDDRYLLNYNDILFARSGSVGKCYIHKNINSLAIFAGYLIRFVLNDEMANPDFIFYYCNSSIYKFWVSAIERPAVQSNINSEEFKKLQIPLPPLEKQNEIAVHIASIRANAKALQQQAEQILAEAKQQVEEMILR